MLVLCLSVSFVTFSIKPSLFERYMMVMMMLMMMMLVLVYMIIIIIIIMIIITPQTEACD